MHAGTGRLNVILVGILAFLAAVIGDNIGFAVGHFGGGPPRRALRTLHPDHARAARQATGFFERHGGKVVTIARFIEGLRQANGIIAGITGMHWAKFLAFNALGAALWVTVWTNVGYLSGNHINTIYNTRQAIRALLRHRRRRPAHRIHRPTDLPLAKTTNRRPHHR